jgi:hypothetical protein
VRTHVPPDLAAVQDAPRLHQEVHEALELGVGGIEVRNVGAGNLSNTLQRYDIHPDSRPSQKGEFTDSARMWGRK